MPQYYCFEKFAEISRKDILISFNILFFMESKEFSKIIFDLFGDRKLADSFDDGRPLKLRKRRRGGKWEYLR